MTVYIDWSTEDQPVEVMMATTSCITQERARRGAGASGRQIEQYSKLNTPLLANY